MSTTAQWVFETAMHLMDELAGTLADAAHTREYKTRTPFILNVLLDECASASDTYKALQPGQRPICPPVESMEDELPLDDGVCRTVLPYGLAAQLYLQEDPVSARSWWDIFQENLALLSAARPARVEDIADVYGGIEHGRYGKW